MAGKQVGFGYRGGGRKGLGARTAKGRKPAIPKKPKKLTFGFKKL